ncbi:MAG: TetR/AcrR family transcriptional regulator [Bacteroidota bacterium]
MNTKRERILDCARTLFAEEGFHNAQISRLAKMSGVGAGSVYLYFNNKEHILEEIFMESWTRIEKRLSSLDEQKELSATKKIDLMVRAIIDMVIEKRNSANIILHEYRFWAVEHNERLTEVVSHSKKIVSRIIAEARGKEFRPEIDPAAATEFIFGGIWYFLALKTAEIDENTAKALGDQISGMILSGLTIE